jgi:copper chaperone
MIDFALAIEGMHCGACVKRVKTALSTIPGVEVDEVEIGRAHGRVESADAVLAVVAAVTRAGYPARSQ